MSVSAAADGPLRELAGPPWIRRVARARRTLLLALVFGVPVAFAWNVFLDPFNLIKFSLLLAGLGLVTGLRLVELAAGVGLRNPKILWIPAAAILLPLTISWLFSPYKGWSLLGQYARYEGLIPYAALVLLAFLLVDSFSGNARPIAVWFVAGAACAAGYALVQSLGLDPLDIPLSDHSVVATIGHPNFFGGLVAIALPLSLALWIDGRGRARVLAAAASAILAVGLLVSLSQGPWAAGIAGIAVFIGLLNAARRPKVAVIAFALTALITAALIGIVVYKQIDPFSPGFSTARSRGLWWRAAIEMWTESPVVGRGPNAFAVEGTHHRLPLDALSHEASFADHPHSVFFAYLANAGTLGGLGLLVLAAWTVRTGVKAAVDRLSAGFAAGAIAYLVLSWVSMDQFSLAFALWVTLAGIAIGAGKSGPIRQEELRDRSPRRLALACAAGVLLVGLSGYFAGRLLWADRLALQTATAARDERYSDAIGSYERSIGLRESPHYRAAFGVQMGRAAVAAEADGGPFVAEMDRAFEFLEDLPYVPAINQYGYWRQQWAVFDPASDEVAIAIFERSLRYDESNPLTRVLLAQTLVHAGEAEKALTALEPAFELLDRYPKVDSLRPDVLGMIAVARHFLGDDPQAAAALADAGATDSEVDPDSVCSIAIAERLIEPPSAEDLDSSNFGLGFICPIAMTDLLDRR